MSGSTILPLFNIGPQIVSQVLGSPYSQYRATTETNPLSVANLIAQINIWITSDEAGRGNKSTKYGNAVWYGMFDPTVTQVGDYLIGPLGTFFIASQNVPQPMQIISCNATVSISAPGGSTTFGAQSAYGADLRASETVMASGWPCSILMSSKQDSGSTRLPGDAKMPTAVVLLPAIPGVTIRNNLILTDANGQRHIVAAAEITYLGWRLTTALATT